MALTANQFVWSFLSFITKQTSPLRVPRWEWDS